jgi:hypothetical protein
MEVTNRTTKVLAISPNNVYMRDLRPGEVIHMMVYVGEYCANDRFIPFKVEYITESEEQKCMSLPISVDISKFLIKEKPMTNSTSSSQLNTKYDFKTHQNFTLNNKSDMQFYHEGSKKLVRYSILNEMEKIEIREDLCEPGYNMQVLSTIIDTGGSRVKDLVEYLKFMYD